MSVYSDKNFKVTEYNKFRPTYPQSIFDKVISYHGDQDIELLVDLGCGPGEATFPFTKYPQIHKILGTDMSQVMVDAAKNLNSNAGKVEFKVASGEDLSKIGIEDASVDIVSAAECSHWFNHVPWIREMSRVLKDNGTLVYWSYVDAVIMDDPIAEEINQNFTYLDERYCGPLWQQPGKEHLRVGMVGVDYFLSKNKDFHKIETKSFDPTFDTKQTDLYIGKELTIGDYMKYLDTWSAVHSWRKIHQEGKDIVELWYEEFNKQLGWDKNTKIKVIWKTHFTLAKRVPRL